MNIEDILRTIVREELKKFFVEKEKQPATSTTEQTPWGVDTVAKVDTPRVVSTASELVSAMKELCATPDSAKEAKEILTSEGYDRFSLVEDGNAQNVYDLIVRRLDA
jgi:hypothetical protein